MKTMAAIGDSIRPMHHFCLALFLVSPLLVSRAADACSLAGPDEHEIDPAEQEIDKEPPGRVETVGVLVRRGKGPETHGCRQSSTSCDDIGGISLSPTPPSDDRTAPSELGYRIRYVDGRVPNGLRIPSRALKLVPGDPPGIGMAWTDGATDEHEAFDFTVTLAAIDKAGNEGPESAPVRIHHSGSSSGCRVARGNELGSFALVLGALFTLGRVMRRRT